MAARGCWCELWVRLVLPVEDLDVASCNAEAVDGFFIPPALLCGGPGGPIVDALLFSGYDGRCQIGGLDGGDMNGAAAVGLLTEHGEGGCGRGHVHEEMRSLVRYERGWPPWSWDAP